MNNLPHEIINEIIILTSMTDRYHVSLVCKLFNKICIQNIVFIDNINIVQELLKREDFLSFLYSDYRIGGFCPGIYPGFEQLFKRVENLPLVQLLTRRGCNYGINEIILAYEGGHNVYINLVKNKLYDKSKVGFARLEKS